MLHDEDLAHDAVHNVFDNVMHSAQQKNVGVGYLLSSVKNVCRNIIRENSLRERVQCKLLIETEEYAEEKWPGEEELEMLHKFIENALTPRCRDVIKLKYEENLRYSEIGERLNITEPTVYKHLRNALEKIKTELYGKR